MLTRGIWAMLKNRHRRTEIYAQSAYWDAKAVDYSGESISLWPNKSLSRLYAKEHRDALERLAAPLEGAKVLDAGCGTGRLARMLAERGASVVAIDFSEQTLREARRNTPSSLDIKFELCSMFELPYEEEFDWVMSWAAATMACQTRGDFQSVLRRFYRALKPGGAVFFLEPFHSNFLRRTLRLSFDQVLEDLRSAGFVISHSEEFHFWPMRLALSYFDLPPGLTGRGYSVGRRLERSFPNAHWGDYKLVVATKPERPGVIEGS
ncbi:class I SAM-dependent methyltransferase [Mycobacterium bourgelatii]|uniref:Methyltransferase domain-containing protein n=1 Tax=Mycobacterium bourgelatii TaxID=1273442 RepID=A0A7I9YNG5_MYCBU|nr:class I SAM-dependent methyltransferase [Mycobacterium bourgelatii]MCV6974077.1 methyltransferase domain-containing protein [Mycobacterium bourgelatii]GFG90224.1 hypothetical protein MBOU_22660 [Mycobacterium bourgelatii]